MRVCKNCGSSLPADFDAEECFVCLFESGFDRRDHGEQPGERIGKFELVETLGEGGMGIVWLAKQDEPGLKREVALKIVKLGMDTKNVVARFEAERQALAMMDHPSIAKVFAAGIANGGRPYFVMERVHGASITDYCDGRKLDTNSRLDLLVDVCRAVQHAHHKGIVHRDIKPSNILVGEHDGKPVAKVIDFGIAKAMSEKITAQTLTRNSGHILGTLAYMSPEQAGGDPDVDTRTDVYSLGAVLYELLTGELPFPPDRLEDTPFDEALKLIREEDPQKPSTCISRLNGKRLTFASNRSTDFRKLQRTVGGDLDAIVMTALAKERSQRYPTPNELAQDIERYLNGEPVEATNQRGIYRLTKFVKRHKVPVIGTAAAAMTLIGITVMSVAQAARVEKARQGEKAGRGSAEKRLVQLMYANELLGSIFDNLDPQDIADDGRPLQSILAEELIEALEKLKEEAIGDPLVVADIQERLGGALVELGESEAAIAPLELSLKVRTSLLGPNHPDTLESANQLACAYREIGDLESAISMLAETYERSKEVLGPQSKGARISLNNLSLALQADGQLDRGLALLKESFETNREHLGMGHANTISAMNNLATGYKRSGELDTAIEMFEEILELRRNSLGENHPDTITSASNLGAMYMGLGKYNEARRLFEQGLDRIKKLFGRDHPDTLMIMQNLGYAYIKTGDQERGLQMQEQTLELRTSKFGNRHPHTLAIMSNLGGSYLNASMPEKAYPILKKAVEINREVRPIDHPEVTASIGNLAMCYDELGRSDLALPLHEERLALVTKKAGSDHPNTLMAMLSLASCYARTDTVDRAIDLYKKTLELSKSSVGEKHPLTSDAMYRLAKIYVSEGELDEGISLFEETLAMRREHLGADHPDTIKTMRRLAGAHGMNGNHEESVSSLREALEVSEEALGKEHLTTLASMGDLARGLMDAGKFKEAVPVAADTLSGFQNRFGKDDPSTMACMSNLATAHFEAGDHESALKQYEELLGIRKRSLGEDHPKTWDSLAEVGFCLNALGQSDKAIPYLEKAYRASRKHPDFGHVGRDLLEAYTGAGEREKTRALVSELVVDYRSKYGDNTPELGIVLAGTSVNLIEVGDFEAAEAQLRKCLKIRVEAVPDSWQRWNTTSMLGGALARQSHFEEAEPLLLRGYEELKSREDVLPSDRPFLNEAIDRLVRFYEDRSQVGDAESALRINKLRPE